MARPQILIISLEKQPWTDEMYEQLYGALRKNASVTEVLTARDANKALSSNPPPSAVLVSDAAITKGRYSALLTRLVEYTRAGGRVVLGVQFSNHISPATVHTFYRKWGVRWNAGSYHRTTFGLNPAGVLAPLSADALFPSFSMKAVHVKDASLESAVYLPTSESKVESLVFAPTPITGDQANESPAVFARVGEGYLGYVGDVNGEQGSIRLTIEMCGVKIKPGDMGARDVTTSVEFLPGGGTRASKERVKEIPLPIPSGSSTSAPGKFSASSAAPAAAASSSKTPPAAASSSTPKSSTIPPPRSSPRPREAEVTARAMQRAKVREEKIKRGDVLKEEGNALFKQEKWMEAAEKYRAAVMAGGPQPVYMANLAAALLKLGLWDLAESAATRALASDPDNVKARFRRALARKELYKPKAAEADLRYILAKDKANAPAHAELDVKADPAAEGVEDPADESDSEDYKHTGNGTPCRYYNHDGCARGQRCRFRHAPDGKSVRDELGRNVCVYWLLGECRFGDTRCVYAHDRTYLPTRGWWTNEKRNARLCSAMRTTVEIAGPLRRHVVPPALLAEAAKPDPWRKDLWAKASYARAAKVRDRYGDDYVYAGEDYEDEDEDDWVSEGGSHERHMEGFYEELLRQGIKPWEVESYDELMGLHSVLYGGY